MLKTEIIYSKICIGLEDINNINCNIINCITLNLTAVVRTWYDDRQF